MPDTAVIVCCHLVERWELLLRALDSLWNQTRPPDEVVVVVDGDEQLLARLFERGGKETILTTGRRSGLSNARNVGLAAVNTEFVGFLDDDAVADPGWLAALQEALESDPNVLGAGGIALPEWEGVPWEAQRADTAGAAGTAWGGPRWFPRELLWTVGCTHGDHVPARIRNLFGGCALFRRSVFDTVGGFDTRLGRRHRGGAGCEETELCMRARAALPDGYFLLVPQATMRHRVHRDRQRLGYVLRRCRDEGRSKATLRRIAPPMPRSSTTGLGPEFEYLTKVLPRGVAAGVRAALHGDPYGLARAGTLIAASATTVASFLWSSLPTAAARAEKASASAPRPPIQP